jgi:hypothetical protein
MGDVEDPEIYAAQPIWDWQQTDKGHWVMEHGSDLTFDIHSNFDSFGYKVTIRGRLDPENEVYYTLKYQ